MGGKGKGVETRGALMRGCILATYVVSTVMQNIVGREVSTSLATTLLRCGGRFPGKLMGEQYDM